MLDCPDNINMYKAKNCYWVYDGNLKLKASYFHKLICDWVQKFFRKVPGTMLGVVPHADGIPMNAWKCVQYWTLYMLSVLEYLWVHLIYKLY